MYFRQAQLPYVKNDSPLFTVIWYYTSILTMTSVLISMVLVLVWLFNTVHEESGKAAFIVNSFMSSESAVHLDPAWQVASKHWGLPGGASTSGGAVYTPYYDAEVATPMTECMFTAQVGRAKCNNDTLDNYFKCIKTNYNTELTACEGLPSNRNYLYPIRTDYAECVWKKVGGSVYNLTVLDRCMDITFWPIYEVIQDVDSEYFLGSFNWALLLIAGFSFFLALVYYSSYPFRFGKDSHIEIVHGKVASSEYMARGSLTQVLVAFVFVLIVVIAMGIICWDYSSNFHNKGVGAPSTVSTQVLIFTTIMAGLSYFLCEIAEFWDARKKANPSNETSANMENVNLLSNKSIPVAFQMQVPNVGYYLNPSTGSSKVHSYEGVLHHYGLSILKTWSDAYVFDVLVFVGVVGCTQHVILAEVYNIFWLMLTLRLVQMVVNRQLYAAYIMKGYQNSNQTDNFKNKAFAFAAELASAFIILNIMFIVFNQNRMAYEISIFVWFFALALVIPESLKFLLHLYLLFGYGEAHKSPSRDEQDYISRKGTVIMVLYQFIVLWDVVVRLILIGILFWQNYPGTRTFWDERHRALMIYIS